MQRQLPRFDPATTQQIIGLAARLKDQQSELLSQAQIEAIAAEVGIEPEYVRQSLFQAEPVLQTAPITLPTPARRSTTEVLPFVARFVASVGWVLPIIPFFLTRSYGGFDWQFSVSQCLSWLGIYLFSSAGLMRASKDLRKSGGVVWQTALHAAWAAGGWVLLILPAILFFSDWRRLVLGILGSLALYIGGLIGLSFLEPKAAATTTIAPESESKTSRDALLAQLFDIQQQLEGTRTMLSFLSLDVVGSSVLKKASAELAVEFTFGEYRKFIEAIAKAEGGELQIAAGDGAMCVFRDEAAAVQAGQRILSELPKFNAEKNRLAEPLRVRAGVNSGVVAWEPGTPIGFLQSTVIDEAARLQKEAEPNTLVLLDPEDADARIVWRV
jgi:class 3 adenylate cyclase